MSTDGAISGRWRDVEHYDNGRPVFRVFERDGLIDEPYPGEPAVVAFYPDGRTAMRAFFDAGQELQTVWFKYDGTVIQIDEPDPVTGEPVTVFDRRPASAPAPALHLVPSPKGAERRQATPAPALRLVTSPDSPELGA
jgi:hypothetical protein